MSDPFVAQSSEKAMAIYLKKKFAEPVRVPGGWVVQCVEGGGASGRAKFAMVPRTESAFEEGAEL